MKNILFVSHSGELNGAELALLQALQRIDRTKFAPFLAVPESGPLKRESEKSEIPAAVVPMAWSLTEPSRVWRQPVSRLWNRRGIRILAGIIREKKIGLVFSNSSAVWSGALAARREKVPHVWYVHEVLDGKAPFLRFLWGNRRAVRGIHTLSRLVICNSKASARAFAGAFPAGHNVRVIYNGVDSSALNAAGPAIAGPKSLREEFKIGPEDPVLGVVGKIYPGKGQEPVVRAAEVLRRQYANLKLLLVGGICDSRYFRRIERFVSDHGLSDCVIVTGYRKDLGGLLRLMNLLVVASTVDSFGRVVLEAMAAGTPVLAVSAGGVPEIIVDGENGFLIPRPEPDIIVQSVRGLLSGSRDLKKVIEAGRRTAAEKFSLELQIKKIEQALEECLEP